MYAELNPDGFSASGTSPSLRKMTFSESLNLYRKTIIKPFLDLLCSMKSDSNHQMRVVNVWGHVTSDTCHVSQPSLTSFKKLGHYTWFQHFYKGELATPTFSKSIFFIRFYVPFACAIDSRLQNWGPKHLKKWPSLEIKCTPAFWVL